jgi:replicative DNA helicase
MPEHINARLENQILATLYQEENSRHYFKKLFPQVFFQNEAKDFFKIIQELHYKSMPFNIEYMMANYGKRLPALEMATIYTESSERLDPKTMFWAVEQIKELYFLRLSLYYSQRMAVAVREENQKLILGLANAIPKVRSAIFKNGQDSSDHFKRAIEVINSTDEYIPFSSPRARALFGGWTKGDVSSCGGKSGHNKTTFILFDAKESIKQGTCNKILYFAIDETGEKIARRIIASEAGISLSGMRNKTVTLDYEEVKKAIGTIFKNKLVIIDDLFDAQQIQQAILDIKPDRFIIDHVQELDYGKDGISDQKVTVACKLFKEAAKLTRSNGTIISQVRDKLIDERFEDKVPRPHDFLYASDLRRKSREQTVVYWEYKDNQDNVALLQNFDFIVWKSTYSDTGRIRFIVDPDKASFSERNVTQAVDARTEESIWHQIERK